jgi:hypothetical protein
MIDYATIENGRVTAVTFGASTLPESTTTVLYWDVTDLDPQPAVTWFFTEPCNEFSATPPRIPPGEVAPPFQPGGDPPDPDDPLTPEVEEPGPPRIAELAYHLTAFHASGPDTITFGGDDPEQEVTPRWRTTVNFANTCGVRIQAHVVTENDVRLIVKGSIDGGTTWDYLNAEYEGPFLKITDSGEAVGPFVNIDEDFAEGDVLVSVFARTGSSTSVTLGNVHLMHAIRVDDAECPIYEILEECAAPAATLVEDFDYADYGAFLTALNAQNFSNELLFGTWGMPNTEGPTYSLDATNTFNGNPSLRQSLDGGIGYGGFIGFDPDTPEDGAYFWVMQIDDTFSPTDGSFAGQKYRLMTFSCERLLGGGPFDTGYLTATGGRVTFEWYDAVADTFSSTDLGPYADWFGDRHQVIVRIERRSSTTLRFRIYRDPPCSTPTLLEEITVTTNLIDGGCSYVYLLDPFGSTYIGSASAYTFQMAYDKDPSVFGI